MKLYEVSDGGWCLWCPGCKAPHVLDKRWTLHGTVESPSFKNCNAPNDTRDSYWLRQGEVNCHFTVIDGKMLFANDCSHELRGQTVDVPEWPG